MKGRQADEFLLTRENGKPVKASRMGSAYRIGQDARPAIPWPRSYGKGGHENLRPQEPERFLIATTLCPSQTWPMQRLKVERGAKAELSQAEIHSSYIEPVQNQVSSDKENARKPYNE